MTRNVVSPVGTAGLCAEPCCGKRPAFYREAGDGFCDAHAIAKVKEAGIEQFWPETWDRLRAVLAEDRAQKEVTRRQIVSALHTAEDPWNITYLRGQLAAVDRELASVDTHPKDGDALAAPLVSGAARSEAEGDAQ